MSASTLSNAPATVNAMVCKQCGVEKDASEFYPNCKKCKPCVREAVRANRAAKREQYAAYERERFHRPERKQQALEAQRRRRARVPHKNAARAKVANALRTGALVRRPCEVCGSTDRVEAHHTDYSKPLDVKWLCFKHHREVGHNQVVVSK